MHITLVEQKAKDIRTSIYVEEVNVTCANDYHNVRGRIKKYVSFRLKKFHSQLFIYKYIRSFYHPFYSTIYCINKCFLSV